MEGESIGALDPGIKPGRLVGKASQPHGKALSGAISLNHDLYPVASSTCPKDPGNIPRITHEEAGNFHDKIPPLDCPLFCR